MQGPTPEALIWHTWGGACAFASPAILGDAAAGQGPHCEKHCSRGLRLLGVCPLPHPRLAPLQGPHGPGKRQEDAGSREIWGFPLSSLHPSPPEDVVHSAPPPPAPPQPPRHPGRIRCQVCIHVLSSSPTGADNIWTLRREGRRPGRGDGKNSLMRQRKKT